MKISSPIAIAAVWLFFAGCQAWAIPDELKEKGVLYFDDHLQQQLTTPLAVSVYLHSDRSLSSPKVAFAKGKEVRVVGMAPEGFLIEGRHQNVDYSGWVPAKAIKIEPSVLQQAEASQQHQDAIKQAIAEKRVLEGMTFDDVRASKGKPEAASFRQEGNRRIDTWRYITYERVPQRTTGFNSFGFPVSRITYVRVPIGELTVDFTEGVVSGIEAHTGKSRRGPRVNAPLNP